MKTFLAGAALALPSLAFASCGAAFCAVNTNWTTQSALVDAGSSFDLRYEYIDQDQPFAGGDKVAVGEVPAHHDEVATRNRNLVATYSRSFGNGWGVALTVPAGQREHLHIHHHHGEAIPESWDFTRMGDLRAVGRFQFDAVGDPLNPSMVGVTFGLKLPTGTTDVANADGDVAERSLQPGSGTTDLVAGAYYHQKLTASDASWFAQAQYQHAVKAHDGYWPGDQFGADLGYRRGVGDKLGLLVQLNFVHKLADIGSEAEPEDSGSRSLFLSPGLSYTLTDNLQAYGFYQHALYRRVTGVQLTADRALVIGISGRL